MQIYVVSAYLLFLVGVSVWRGRGARTQDDFMVAGRGVSALFLAGTLVCTWVGSGSLFGGAGRAFRQGFPALWLSAGAWAGIAVVYFLAPRVRRIAQYTVPDILELRYNPASRLLGTVAILLAYLTIAGYQFIGGGRLLHILTGMDPVAGQAVVCGLVIVYTAIGGMSSVVALDIFNGLLITVGVLVAAPLALRGAGGWEAMKNALPASHFTLFGSAGFAASIGIFLPTFLLLLGESSIYQKFMSARDERAARRAAIGMVFGVIVVETALVALAVFGAARYWTDGALRLADGSLDRAATETIILKVAANALPAAAGTLLLVGAAAIVFSTANTFLVIPSTNLTRDIFQRFLRPGASQRTLVRFQRGSIVALALLALLVTSQFENILDMALYAYTMVGAAITPALLAAFLWKRVTPAGGTASIAAGIGTTMFFAALARSGMRNLDLGLFRLPLDYDYIIYPAGIVSFAALVGVSLLTRPSPEEKWKPLRS